MGDCHLRKNIAQCLLISNLFFLPLWHRGGAEEEVRSNPLLFSSRPHNFRLPSVPSSRPQFAAQSSLCGDSARSLGCSLEPRMSRRVRLKSFINRETNFSSVQQDSATMDTITGIEEGKGNNQMMLGTWNTIDGSDWNRRKWRGRQMKQPRRVPSSLPFK